MKKLMVLQIGKYFAPYLGGAERYLENLIEELKEHVDLEVLVANTKFKTEVEFFSGVKIVRLASLGRLFSLPLTLSMPFWLKRFNVDIMHFHIPNPLSVISCLMVRPKAKIVVTYHSDIIRQKIFLPLYTPFLRAFLRKASCILVSSDNLIKSSFILGEFKDKCKVVPHGINLQKFASDQYITQRSESIKRQHAKGFILFVGRIVYYKGLEFLLEAIRDIDIDLVIVGRGPFENRLKMSCRRLKIKDKVFWLGRVDDKELVSLYNACEFLVLPSHLSSESFGIVQLEAFACFKPVISTNLPTGVPFVNIDNKTGLIVPPGNVPALTHSISKLLADPRLREEFGRNAHSRLIDGFTREKMAEEVLKIYRSLDNNY